MYTFSNFAGDLENIVDTSNSYQSLIDRGIEIMRKLIANPELIDKEQLVLINEGQIDNTVYKSEKNNFIVQIFTWYPHCETPIHDHNTWGLMGIYQNGLRVAEYNFKNNNLTETQNYIAEQGDVCYLIPPDEEIHQISNTTDDMSISIHVYGKTIDEYNIYDLENGEIIHQVV